MITEGMIDLYQCRIARHACSAIRRSSGPEQWSQQTLLRPEPFQPSRPAASEGPQPNRDYQGNAPCVTTSTYLIRVEDTRLNVFDANHLVNLIDDPLDYAKRHCFHQEKLNLVRHSVLRRIEQNGAAPTT